MEAATVAHTDKPQIPHLAMVMLPAWTKPVEARPSGLIGDLSEVPRLTRDQLAQGGAKTFIEFGISRITHAIASLGEYSHCMQTCIYFSWYASCATS